MTDAPSILDLTIRDARLDDAALVKFLYGQMAPDISNVDRDFPTLVNDDNALCWVLQERDKPVGMLIAYERASLSSGRKLVIDELVIDKDHRGHGYGKFLVDRCIAEARDKKLDCIELACSLVKPELHRYYEEMGFHHRMRLYAKFLDGEG